MLIYFFVLMSLIIPCEPFMLLTVTKSQIAILISLPSRVHTECTTKDSGGTMMTTRTTITRYKRVLVQLQTMLLPWLTFSSCAFVPVLLHYCAPWTGYRSFSLPVCVGTGFSRHSVSHAIGSSQRPIMHHSARVHLGSRGEKCKWFRKNPHWLENITSWF